MPRKNFMPCAKFYTLQKLWCKVYTLGIVTIIIDNNKKGKPENNINVNCVRRN